MERQNQIHNNMLGYKFFIIHRYSVNKNLQYAFL